MASEDARAFSRVHVERDESNTEGVTDWGAGADCERV